MKGYQIKVLWDEMSFMEIETCLHYSQNVKSFGNSLSSRLAAWSKGVSNASQIASLRGILLAIRTSLIAVYK